MSVYTDQLAAAFLAAIPPPPMLMTVGTVMTATSAGPPGGAVVRIITVSLNGGDPIPAQWSSAFDVVLQAVGLNTIIGQKVLILLPDGQPIISDLIVRS